MPRTSLVKGRRGALAGGMLAIAVAANTPADPVAAANASPDISSLSPESADSRIVALRAEIARHDALYFQHAAPEISDAAYDALKRELRTLERAYPRDAAGEGSQPTLADDHSEGFDRAVHRMPMLGLNKAYTEAELRDFCERTTAAVGAPSTFVIEPKIDGIAVSVVYENGRFVRAITRGNGREGDDITAQVRAIRSLPTELRAKKSTETKTAVPLFIELRGEIFISRENFIRLNREREAAGDAPFAHPRNVAAGTIKSREPREVVERRLDIVFYGWGACEPSAAAPLSQQDFLAQARAWGLPVLETYSVANDTAEVWNAVQTLGRQRRQLAAPTDGAVIKVDGVASRIQLGESSDAPRWAVAYKFSAEHAATRLRAIKVQVGRTGVLTPVAEFEPVTLGGATITRATLHNRAVINRLGLQTGDFVEVEKSGEVIPTVVGVDTSRRSSPGKPFEFPKNCPACSTPLATGDDRTVVRCPNFSGCPAQIEGRLVHFAGKSGVQIAGLGEATVALLVKNGRVRNPADLYRLRLEDFVSLPRFGEKSAARLLAEIEGSRQAELWRFICALGIRRVGASAAQALSKHFGTLRELGDGSPENFNEAVGDATAQEIVAWLSIPENRALLAELDDARELHHSVSLSHRADAIPTD